MKLAVVVQRYGQAINGGAELHARYIAEHLAKHVEVDVLTTCAKDYVTWSNELKPGIEDVNGLKVRRFPVRHERDPHKFGRRSERVFTERHSLADEASWLDAEGPASPALITHVRKSIAAYDFFLFFSYRYYHAYWGVRAAAQKAILIPTAERDPAIGLAIFSPIFRGVRALMYNSPEERAMIGAVSGNQSVPGVVVGIGSEVPQNPQAARFRAKYGLRGPFAVYVGRIDENKGCKELFEFFTGYADDSSSALSLVLIGHSLLPVPSHPRIRHLGFVDDMDKFDAVAAADALIMPSYFESLSMVALEAWALGKPVIANGRCDVLKGQCIRSNAGLYYENGDEFVEAMRAIEKNRWLAAELGRNGRQFYRDSYDWPVIERKYVDMLTTLSREALPDRLDPLPSWWARRKRAIPAAAETLAAIPSGPSRVGWEPASRVREAAPADHGPADRPSDRPERMNPSGRPPYRAGRPPHRRGSPGRERRFGGPPRSSS